MAALVGVGSGPKAVDEDMTSLDISISTADDIEITGVGRTEFVEVTTPSVRDTSKLVTGAATVVVVGITVLLAMAPSIELVGCTGVLTRSAVLLVTIGACALVISTSSTVLVGKLSCTVVLSEGIEDSA